MISDVIICNLAASKIGDENGINAIGEDSRLGRQCELLYEFTRDTLLAEHPWNFAIGRKSLSQDSDSPDFGFDNQFILPADCLRCLRVDGDSNPFKIESGKLLTDSLSVDLIYIKKVTDTSVFSPLFINVLVLRLATALSNVIAGSLKVAPNEVKDALRDAKLRDGQEGTPDVLTVNGPTDYKGSNWRF